MDTEKYKFRFESKDAEKIAECMNSVLQCFKKYDLPVTLEVGILENLKLTIWNEGIKNYYEQEEDGKSEQKQ